MRRESEGSAGGAPPAAGERHHAGREFLRVALAGRVPEALPGMSESAVRLDVWRALGRFDPRFQHCDTFFWFRLLLDYGCLQLAHHFNDDHNRSNGTNQRQANYP